MYSTLPGLSNMNMTGPSNLKILSMIASSLAPDSVYGLADQITITFSEDTNMGGSYQGKTLAPSEVKQIFNFSQELGLLFSGNDFNLNRNE